MTLTVQKQNNEYKLIPQGSHVARLIQIIDMGLQDVEWQGVVKQMPKVRFTWELPNETSEFEGVIKPLVIGQDYTLSMGGKSNLRPIVEGIIGATLKDEEAYNFDMESFKGLLGTPCLIQVIHKISKTGKTYANVGGVLPMMKGVTVPPQFNESVIFEIENATEEQFNALPKFMQDKISKSKNAEPLAPSKFTLEEKSLMDSLRGSNVKQDFSEENLAKLAKDDNRFDVKEEDLASSIPF